MAPIIDQTEQENSKYYNLAKRLSLKQDSVYDTQSQAVSMAGVNAVSIDCAIYESNADYLKINLEQSNDLENWVDLTSTYLIDLDTGSGAPPNPGYYVGTDGSSKTADDIGMAYVRLRYQLVSPSAGERCILSAGLTTYFE